MVEKIEDYWLTLKGIFLFFFFLRKSCFRSEELVKKEQYWKLKKLLKICEENVPYYQGLFKDIDFVVGRDFQSLADLNKIPLTTKEIVKRHPEQFVNPHYQKNALVFKTSGSTGSPMSVLVSKKQWVLERGVIWRHWSWAGYAFRDKMAIVRSFAPKDGILIKHDKVRNFRYYSPFHLSEQNISLYIEDMVKEKVKFLRGYPSSIKPLAEYVLENKCQIPKLKAILTASEILLDNDRRVIERAFKCKIFNHYGLAEGIVMLGDCESHDGLHNYDEYGYLELLDSDIDGVKKVVGTNLNNYAMPLLRYETNDLAELAEKRCGCGRSSIVVKNIIGRSNSAICFLDRKIPLTNFYTVLEHYTRIIGWQIIQESFDIISLRIEGEVSAKEEQEICFEFKGRLPDGIIFKIEKGVSFVKVNEGKRPPFISMI